MAVEGVDVSEWQSRDVKHTISNITWPKVIAAGIRFASIRSSRGDHDDPMFRTHMGEAIDAALERVGPYHFYSFDVDPIVQARRFVKATATLPMTLRPEVDIEAQDCKATPQNKITKAIPALSADYAPKLATAIRAFILEAENGLGCELSIYTFLYFWPQFGKSGLDKFFADRALSLAVYPKTPKAGPNPPRPFPPWLKCTQWQYGGDANGARVDGVDGFCDRRVFIGTDVEFLDYCRAPRTVNEATELAAQAEPVRCAIP